MIDKKQRGLWRCWCITEGMRPRFTVPLATIIWVIFTMLSVDWASAAR